MKRYAKLSPPGGFALRCAEPLPVRTSVVSQHIVLRHDEPALENARAALVEALVRTGEEDRDAFRRVYRMTSAKLFGICLRICEDRQGAEDVLHDVYLTIWNRAGAYQPGRASPISWLATIARNRAIDWRRRQGRMRAAPVEEADGVPDGRPAQDDLLMADEINARLHDCLEGIESRQRSAIRSAFFGGLTYSELAERQAVPLGTMKSWVRRGLLALRGCLDAEA
jgi:RNA polymerase sigma factor (sigma-70 family)